MHKNNLPKVIEIDALVIFEAQNDTFLIKRLPKSPRFEKKYSPFYLLDRQVDILSIILRQKLYILQSLRMASVTFLKRKTTALG